MEERVADMFTIRNPFRNGVAAGLRAPRPEVDWWLEGGGAEHLAEINVAALLVQRQSGAARLRDL
eukprot:3586214-Lingulodinium_polyedra.AAC.1